MAFTDTSATLLLCKNADFDLCNRRGLALASLGGPVYAVGGLDDTTCFNTVERYDPTTDSWTFVAAMLTPRGGVGLTALKVRLFCAFSCFSW